MAQFRVEFVLDQASGKYLAELYDPENPQRLIVRTEPVYPTQAAAVLGVVDLFKDALTKMKRKADAAGVRKRARAARAGTSARRKPRRRARR